MNDLESSARDLDVSEIDKVIYAPASLGIVAHLYVLDSADALFLKNQMGLTCGNLSSHIIKLEDTGYIEVIKEFVESETVHFPTLDPKGKRGLP